jgi:hypothetical protein
MVRRPVTAVLTGRNLVMTSIPKHSTNTTSSPPRLGPLPFEQTLPLSHLLCRTVVGAREQKLGGRLSDVIVRLRGSDYPLVTGVVAELGPARLRTPPR